MTDPWQNWLNADEREELTNIELFLAEYTDFRAIFKEERATLRRRAERRRQRANG